MRIPFNIFSLNKKFHHGGGLLRVVGLMRFLLSNGIDFKLICADKILLNEFPGLHLEVTLSKTQKRISQVLVALGLNSIATKYLNGNLNSIASELHKNNVNIVLACEHLDITIAYLLKNNNFINGYISDVHGYSLQEFAGKGVVNAVKRWLLRRHDREVFNSADAIIYPNKILQKEMEHAYSYTSKTCFYLPYLLTKDKLELQEYVFKKGDWKIDDQIKLKLSGKGVVFFAGSFKTLSGVDDLVRAYIQSNGFEASGRPCILFLIGDGLLRSKVIKDLNLSGLEYIHIESIEYKYLKCFQALADVIICPEPFNLYSNLIVHLKLLDSIASGKCVVTPRFKAICEMGLEEKVIMYPPSDIKGMQAAIHGALVNATDYSKNVDFAVNFLTYEKYLLGNFESDLS